MRKLTSILLIFLFICTLFPVNVFGNSLPEVYRDSVSVKVGSSTNVGFSYGSSVNKVEIVVSNLRVEAFVSGSDIVINGVAEGTSYVTLNFFDGTSKVIKVTVVNKYGSNSSSNDLEIEKDKTKSIYIDLSEFDSTKATITYDSDIISVNKTTFYNSDYLKITGKRIGESELKIKYNSGDVEFIYISIVSDSYSNNYDVDIEMDLDNYFYFFVDLDYYDADSATISFDSDYISVNKSRFTSSSDLKLKAKKKGTTEIIIKYDNGEKQYLNIDIYTDYSYSDPYVSVNELEIEEDSYEYLSIYLGESSKATLSINNNNIDLSASVIYSDTRIKVYGNNVGNTNIKILFDDGTKITVPINVINTNYKSPMASLNTNKIKKNEIAVLSLNLGSENSNVTITLENPEKFKLDITDYSKYKSTYTIYESKNTTVDIKITGVELVSNTYINIKFPEGKTYKLMLSVVNNKSNYTDGFNKNGENYKLNTDLIINENVLKVGYISGYADGTFKPLSPITREEFGVMLSRLIYQDSPNLNSNYPIDVTASWSKDSITKLYSMGIVTDLKYRPSVAITREEVVEMLYNVLDLYEYSTVCPLSDIGTSVKDKKIAKCYNAGVISGYTDGTFGGKRTITRAEVVVILNRTFYSDMYSNKVNIFSDVNKDYWAYSAILKASKY